jgi:hypothetical protein
MDPLIRIRIHAKMAWPQHWGGETFLFPPVILAAVESSGSQLWTRGGEWDENSSFWCHGCQSQKLSPNPFFCTTPNFATRPHPSFLYLSFASAYISIRFVICIQIQIREEFEVPCSQNLWKKCFLWIQILAASNHFGYRPGSGIILTDLGLSFLTLKKLVYLYFKVGQFVID